MADDTGATGAAAAVGVDAGRAIADAVLFEGYLLYPYRASAAKNQVRWQFGVLFPREWAQAQVSEAWASHTEVLLEPGGDASLHVVVRCLHVQARTVERASGHGFEVVASLTVDGDDLLGWDEGTVQEVGAVLAVADLLEREQTVPIALPGDRSVEEVHDAAGQLVGRIVRERGEVQGRVRVAAERVGVQGPGFYNLVRVRLDVENVTPAVDRAARRQDSLRGALIAAHALVAVSDGAFVSLLEPPEWARAAVESCRNEGAFPVLVGPEGRRDVVLSSPIILYDYPEIAAESPGELFDGTEIDEILMLRTLTLTDEEKREARATDPRAAGLLDRVETLPPDIWERLHGAIRSVRPTAQPAHSEVDQPWWDPGADASVSPETDSVWVGGVAISKGSRVRLAPGGRADAQDMFLVGREGTVAAVLHDVDENVHLAITLADDPGADLQNALGRYRYFSPDEVVPLEGAP